MTNGLLLGKFMPFHTGHEYLINFARNHCEKLIVMVCTQSNEPIPGKLRYEWIRDTFPDVIVKHITDDNLPQEPPAGTDQLSNREVADKFILNALDETYAFRHSWINAARKAADGMKIDFYYASEEYGRWMAEGLDAEFVPVDFKREAVPISGTMVRDDNIYGQWDFLPEKVRTYYVKRIVFMGPESSGKTTAARRTAGLLNTSWVPEYGRTYTKVFDHLLKADAFKMSDFEKIRKGHEASVKALRPKANKFLIEDTDPLMTAVWCEILTGSRWFGYGSPTIDVADKYILLAPTIQWEQDGTRYFTDFQERVKAFQVCTRILEEYNTDYTIIYEGEYFSRNKKIDDTVYKYVNSVLDA